MSEGQDGRVGGASTQGLQRDCSPLLGRTFRGASELAGTHHNPRQFGTSYRSLQDCSPRGRVPAPFAV